MEKWKLDVAVLCIFFARPEQFKQSFEQVKKIRPRTLLLWQDGPREGREDDVENIRKCREIAENIDWECEVYRKYHDTNMGCDPSTFYSQKWAFSIVDKCIILEDDLVPSESFFVFCKEMLDKYENDTRIDRICGTNLLGIYQIPYSYFFSRVGNSSGWASWRRVAEKWQEDYRFMDNEYAISRMRALQSSLKPHLIWEEECLLHKSERIPYWEHIVGAQTLLNSGLVIYPRENMIKNIGLSENSTHAPDNISKLPRYVQEYFNRASYEIQFPLKHPEYILEDRIFLELCLRKTKGNFLTRIVRLIERVFVKLKNIGR